MPAKVSKKPAPPRPPVKPSIRPPDAPEVTPEALPDAHPLDYAATGHRWTCPKTGMVLEKLLARNLDQRELLLKACDANMEIRAATVQACTQSFLFWLNMFGWTYRQHEVLEDGTQRPVKHADIPFITWPVQDAAADDIVYAVENGEDIVLDKSRDMGATWLCLAVMAWRWMFFPNTAMKVLSRKEEEVDSPENTPNPDTLLWKFRYLIEHQPRWMQPPRGHRTFHEVNRSNSSVINGESTNDNAGRGGRTQVQLLDECSVYDNLAAILRATDQSASCRILNATPVGPTDFSEIRFSGRMKVVVLGFWDHPEKGLGRYITEENGKKVWTSPWRERMKLKRDAKTIAQNIDIDHQMSGSMFFDSPVLTMQMSTYGKDPILVGDLAPRSSGDELDIAIRGAKVKRWPFAPDARKTLLLWLNLEEDENGVMRPPQGRIYAFGCDVSHGSGASNSVIFGVDAETREQVMEYTTASMDPSTFARHAAMLGWWFGGVRGMAFMAWENNGPGVNFTKTMVKLSYPWLYQDTIRGEYSTTDTPKLGWNSTGGLQGSKVEVFGNLREGLERGYIKVRSRATLTEMGKTVYYKNANIGPARLEEESADVRLTHGDRVIAAAVCLDGLAKMPRIEPRKPRAPVLSIAWLDEEEERKKAEKAREEEAW